MDLVELTKSFGLPIAMFVVGIWGIVSGRVVTGKSHEQTVTFLKETNARERAEAEAERERMRAEFATRLRETEERAIRWETIAWEAVTTAKYAAEKTRPVK